MTMNGSAPIPMGIGETGPSPRPRKPFEPVRRQPAHAPPPQEASRGQKLAMVVMGILAVSAVAGGLATAVWNWQVGIVAGASTMVGLLWVLLLHEALRRYTTDPEPPCLHAVLGRTEGNVARTCCNAERCPLLAQKGPLK